MSAIDLEKEIIFEQEPPETAKNAKPSRSIPAITPEDAQKPIPQSLVDLINNIIRGVEVVSRYEIPTDRQMKSLQIAVELLKDGPKIAEALGRHNAFQPTLTAELEESSEQRQTIARLRTIYSQAKLPAPASAAESARRTRERTK